MVPINRPGEPHDYRVRVRVDVHTELFSFTYIIDEIGWKTQGRMAQQIDRLLDSSNPDAQFAAIEWLFNGMWDSGELPCAGHVVAWRRRPGSGRGVKPLLGTLITDFRGVIVCPGAEWDIDVPRLEEEAIRHGERRERYRRLDESLTRFAQKNADLIRHIADSKPEAETTEKGEAVVCGMLHGKALYAAALGEWSEDAEVIQPIRHLLVFAGTSYSQLGRLLRRMHILGELRHAALIDYDPQSEDDEPGKPARDEKRGLRDASRAIATLSRDLTGQTQEITISDSPIEKLEGFVARLADISQMVNGGLTYRVEQSRYYAREFKDTIRHLRVTRVGDWQAYDDFVERYIMHLFARIDGIGNRYEALGRRLDRLLFFAQAKILDGYTKSVDSTVQQIKDVTSAMRQSAGQQVETLNTLHGSSAQQFATLQEIDRALARQAKTLRAIDRSAGRQFNTLQNMNRAMALMNRSARRQIHASNRQIGLLTMAERFAIVFLIYYVGSVFHHWFEEGHHLWLIDKERFLIGWGIAIGAAGAWLLAHLVPHFYRRVRNWWKGERPRAAIEAPESETEPDSPAPGDSDGVAEPGR